MDRPHQERPPSPGPPSTGRPPPDRPQFAFFFSLSRHSFHYFLHLLLVLSWIFGGVFEGLDLQRAHLRVRRFKNTTKIPREDSQRETERANMETGEGKKARNFGPFTLRWHTLSGPHNFGAPKCPPLPLPPHLPSPSPLPLLPQFKIVIMMKNIIAIKFDLTKIGLSDATPHSPDLLTFGLRCFLGLASITLAEVVTNARCSPSTRWRQGQSCVLRPQDVPLRLAQNLPGSRPSSCLGESVSLRASTIVVELHAHPTRVLGRTTHTDHPRMRRGVRPLPNGPPHSMLCCPKLNKRGINGCPCSPPSPCEIIRGSPNPPTC